MHTTIRRARRTALGLTALAALGASTAHAQAPTLPAKTVDEGATAVFQAKLTCTPELAGPAGECAFRFLTAPGTATVDSAGPASRDYNPFAVLGQLLPVGGTKVVRFRVKTHTDKVCEGRENFFVHLTVNDAPLSRGIVTIKESCIRKLGRACANADKLVTEITTQQAATAVLCLTNEKRRKHGAPAVTANATLAGSAQSHTDKAVRLRWWDPVNGAVSHDDPEIDNPEDGRTPESDATMRIRGAGYCASGGSWTVAENTFGATNSSTRVDPAAGIYPPTARGAVEWWYHSTKGHRETMLNPQLRELGVGVAGGSAFPQDTGGMPSGTVVQQYGSCG